VNLVRQIKFVRRLVVLGTVLTLAGFAHATSITYNLTGVKTADGTLTGTVTINSVTDLVTAANITFNDAAFGNPVYNINGTPNAYNGMAQDYITAASNGPLNFGGQIALYYDTANIGKGNLNLCLYGGACGTETNQPTTVQAYVNGNGGPFDITAGALDPVPTAAPEPSSLLLLGTGLLGIAGLGWRRSNKP
jgi:hypothetical protein